jgi:hypothetical protein
VTTVPEYIAGIKDPQLRRLVRRVRSIVAQSLPRATESIKWEMISYSINKENVAGISEYSHQVNLYFFSGAKLSSKLLEGSGKGMRHIKLTPLSDIDEKEISRLLKRAAKLVDLP